MCILVSIIQCALSFTIAWFYNEQELVLPICTLSLMYLILPLYKTSSALIQRDNRLEIIALGRIIQSFLLNIITVCFALLGLGIWSVVFAMILSSTVLIFIYNKNLSWRPTKIFTIAKWKEVTSIGGSMIGIQIMDRIRLDFDYIIVGRILGVEALGVYFFAFTSGLGISTQIINSAMVAWLPYLSSVKDNIKKIKSRFFGSLKSVLFIIIPFVILQISLSPFYVPVIFGSKWIPAIPILMIICFSAIPLTIDKATYQLMIAMKKFRVLLIWNFIFTLIFCLSLVLIVKWGILWIAVTVLVCRLINSIFSFMICKYTFGER